MDQITSFVEPGRQFAKDSIRLVKRCTKPDRKGNNFLENSFDQNYLFKIICLKFQFNIYQFNIFIRIPKNCNGNCNRFCYYGFYWVLC